MRILEFSDAHLDASTAGMRRIDDLSNAFGRVYNVATEYKVDAVMFLGDLADPDCGSILVRVLDETIKLATRLGEYGVDFFAIPGNHDTIEDGSGLTTLHPLRHIVGARLFERPKAVDYKGYRFGFLPYPSRVGAYDPVQAAQEFFLHAPKSKKTALFGHCTDVPGAKKGSESGDLARGGTLRFPVEECAGNRLAVDHLANGHFHHQQVTDDGVHIPGSLERLRFDEELNIPGVFIVDL